MTTIRKDQDASLRSVSGLTKSFDESKDDSLHGSTVTEGTPNVTDEDLKKAIEEGRGGLWLRLSVLGIVLVVAIVLTVLIYHFTAEGENADFEQHFYTEAEKVFVTFGRTLDLRMGSADAYMYRAVSYAASVGSVYPYATLPDHCVQNSKLLSQMNSFVLQHFVYVANKDRSHWENYTAGNHDWVEDCLTVQEKDPNYEGPIIRDYGISNELFDSFGGVPTNYTNPYLIAWTAYPVVPVWPPYNWNAMDYREYSLPMNLSMDTLSVILTPVVNNAPPDDPELIASAEHTNDWASDYLKEDEDPTEPSSVMYYPIHDAVDNVVVNTTTDQPIEAFGALAFTFYWRHIMADIVSDESAGVSVVFTNLCGHQVFSYLVDGPQPTFLGYEDVHDGKFSSLCISKRLLELSNLDGDYTGRPINADYCPFEVTICPTQAMEDQFVTNKPAIFAVAAALISLFLLTTFAVLMYGLEMNRRQKITLGKALQARNIVNDVFPAAIRDRLLEREEEGNRGSYTSTKKRVSSFLNDGLNKLADMDHKAKPIADLYPEATIMIADVVNFTPWSSTRDPTQVFTFLQAVYQGFDRIIAARKAFKVEVVGDSYLAASGVPDPNDRHAIVMAHCAEECLFKFHEITRLLDVQLGPDTSDLKIRIGLHSGPVVAGVLSGSRARFQLFGNTVNMAARMESHGAPNRIHLSKVTADLLSASGRSNWFKPNPDLVHVKGKGLQQTYWLVPQSKYAMSDISSTGSLSGRRKENDDKKAAGKTKRLIEWNVQTLSNLLKPVVARRNALLAANKQRNSSSSGTDLRLKGKQLGRMPLDEVQDVLKLPLFDEEAACLEVNPEQVVLDPKVIEQLRSFVTEVSKLYHSNFFHNWEHASHVASSVEKLLKRIVAPDIDVSAAKSAALGLHDYSYGITSDPLTQFGVVFSALIHDADHRGISNVQLGKEQPELAEHYKNKSLAEQNSVDLAWDLLMRDEYRDLRYCIYGNSNEDMLRFRKIVVAVVLATDIFDKELNDLRKGRWNKAFAESLELTEQASRRDFKATIVIEHLIQASDVSHTMQHWQVYRKWNERLFLEMYHAYKAGRMGADPSTFWAKGEIGFFDNYIIPLAKKLKECNVFGVSSDEYLNYAVENREEWAQKGEAIVEELKAKYCRVEPETATGSANLLEALVETEEDTDDLSV